MNDVIEIEIVNPNLPSHNLQRKVVTPSNEAQTITADEGYYGLSEVVVTPPVVNSQDIIDEVASVKSMLTEGDATPEDIKKDKIAYVNGKKVVGSMTTRTTLNDFLLARGNLENLFKDFQFPDGDSTSIIKGDDIAGFTSTKNMFSSSSVKTVGLFDTSKVTDMSFMFYNCQFLVTVPSLDTSKVTDMSFMFYKCKILVNVPSLDTSKVTDMSFMFYNCQYLVTIPSLDTSNVTHMYGMFDGCGSLSQVSLDMSKVTVTTNMFYYCTKLTYLTLNNIRTSITVGSGISYGHKLTLESLLGLCQECIDVGSSRTLTIGSSNMSKLSSIYVKLAENPKVDESVGKKLPFVQCESGDDGAMTISEYMSLKKWSIS